MGKVTPAQGAVPLGTYIGERLRRAREARGLRQDDIAAAARRWGLRWSRSAVAAIEAGQRDLTLHEFLLLPWIAANQAPEAVMRGDDQSISLADLMMPPEFFSEWVTLTPRVTVSTFLVRAVLAGAAGSAGAEVQELFHVAPSSGFGSGRAHRRSLATMGENEAVRAFWPDAERADLEAANRDKLGEAEQKAAKRLQTFPLAVAAVSRMVWGRSLTEERDRRLTEAAAGSLTPRSLQALRGHMSRVLLKELRELGIEGLKPRRPATRRRGRRRWSPR